ncbi:hypothetical protein LUZ60_001948 [Juncus effusus]|nr:hypothetical protein LUZ60_001948 [Juncus effusus]
MKSHKIRHILLFLLHVSLLLFFHWIKTTTLTRVTIKLHTEKQRAAKLKRKIIALISPVTNFSLSSKSLSVPNSTLVIRPLITQMSSGAVANWIKSPFDNRKASDFSGLSFKCRNPFGSISPNWLASGLDSSVFKVRVAADYSDSKPDSKNYIKKRGYHPLEEFKENSKKKDLSLSDVELARTIAQANGKALIVFPGRVHIEPHNNSAWSEFQYVIDEYGEIYFELLDEKNLLHDHGGNNPVTVLIGMNSSSYGEKNAQINELNSHTNNSNLDDSDSDYDDDDDYEIKDNEVNDVLIEWGMPNTLRQIHPIYFIKCLSKAVEGIMENKIEYPTNGLSIDGYLRPVYFEEESYLRSLFNHHDHDNHHHDDGYISDWSDGEATKFNFKEGLNSTRSTLYKLEMIEMEVFSLYGNQSSIVVHDFQDAEPDILACSSSLIIDRINIHGKKSNSALRALCRKKKGLIVEEANIIGVDRLGFDVRAFLGLEIRTLRFSFNTSVMTAKAAESKIKRMLFPRSYGKNVGLKNDVKRDD